MRKVGSFLLLLGILLTGITAVHAEEPAPHLDVVTLKNGTTIYGEVVEMAGGVLVMKTPFSPDPTVKVKWEEVSALAVNHPIPFHLKEGTVLLGTATAGSDGNINIQSAQLKGSLTVPVDSITAVNPLVQPPVIYAGSFTAGYSEAVGNSKFRNASALLDFVARSEQLRLSINGRYVYSDNAEALTARNSRGTIKLDFFMTKRLYWFASAYVESDRFQDLKMRTALATGPGYQFIERGDYTGIFKDMTFYGEAGISYFNEDFREAADQSSSRARISMKLNWPILDERITFYHYDEIYPSLENFSNIYLTMDNGMRFKIWEGFVANIQVTTRYNSKPAVGTTDTDNLYLLTLGYSFDTTRKR